MRHAAVGEMSPHYIPDYFLISDDCPQSYLSDKRGEEHPDRVTRNVWDRAPYSGCCSTDFQYVDVTLPRVSMLDGPYIGARS